MSKWHIDGSWRRLREIPWYIPGFRIFQINVKQVHPATFQKETETLPQIIHLKFSQRYLSALETHPGLFTDLNFWHWNIPEPLSELHHVSSNIRQVYFRKMHLPSKKSRRLIDLQISRLTTAMAGESGLQSYRAKEYGCEASRLERHSGHIGIGILKSASWKIAQDIQTGRDSNGELRHSVPKTQTSWRINFSRR